MRNAQPRAQEKRNESFNMRERRIGRVFREYMQTKQGTPEAREAFRKFKEVRDAN